MARKPDIPPTPGPSPFARGPTGMSGAVTAGLGLLLLALLFAKSASPQLDRLATFERAPETVVRVFERRLELAAAIAELPAWERGALAPFVPVDPHTAHDAALAFREVVEGGHRRSAGDPAAAKSERGPDDQPAGSPGDPRSREPELDGLRARRAILLAEARRIDEAQGDLDELTLNGHAAFVAAVRALASGRANPDDLALAGDGWIGRSAIARARGESPPKPGDPARDALAWARGLAGLVAVGTAVLLAWLARNRPESVAASIEVPSPWSPQTGFGVLVRAAVAAVLLALGLERILAATGGDVPHVELAVATLPLLWLAKKHLARPHRLTLPEVAGIPATASTVVIATLALFALAQVGGRALATAAMSTGALDPWTSQIDEFVVWSDGRAFAIAAFDEIVFGALAIELAFRGILFPSLRHVHGPIHAALLSGLLYSVVHVASLPEMLALSWTGFVFALSVERTRSLLPAIACAAIGSAFQVGILGALYR